jgi:hypothetical protein
MYVGWVKAGDRCAYDNKRSRFAGFLWSVPGSNR